MRGMEWDWMFPLWIVRPPPCQSVKTDFSIKLNSISWEWEGSMLAREDHFCNNFPGSLVRCRLAATTAGAGSRFPGWRWVVLPRVRNYLAADLCPAVCRRVGAEVTISPGNNAAVSRVRGHTGLYIVSLASAHTILYFTSLRCCIKFTLYFNSIQSEFLRFCIYLMKVVMAGEGKGAHFSKYVAETLPSGTNSPQNCVILIG